MYRLKFIDLQGKEDFGRFYDYVFAFPKVGDSITMPGTEYPRRIITKIESVPEGFLVYLGVRDINDKK